MTTAISGRAAAISSQRDLARALARPRQGVDAAGERDHLRHPVAAGERRVEPLERRDPGARRVGDRGPDGVDPGPQLPAQALAAVADAAGLAEADEVAEDLVEGRGVEREHLGGARQARGDRANVVVGDGADRAERLGDDQVGALGGKRLLIELVERIAGADQLPHPGVDLRRLEALGDDAAGQARQPRRRLRVVALVGDGDDLLAEPEREQRLGRRGDEAGDPHGREGSAWRAH